MKIYDSFRSALQSLVVNKLRSALTMLGVIIGVAAVIAMVSVGNGASQSVQNTILNLGSNLVTVSPSFGSDNGLKGAGAQAQNLTLDDMRSIQDQLGASIAAAEAEQQAGLDLGPESERAGRRPRGDDGNEPLRRRRPGRPNGPATASVRRGRAGR